MNDAVHYPVKGSSLSFSYSVMNMFKMPIFFVEKFLGCVYRRDVQMGQFFSVIWPIIWCGCFGWNQFLHEGHKLLHHNNNSSLKMKLGNSLKEAIKSFLVAFSNLLLISRR